MSYQEHATIPPHEPAKLVEGHFLPASEGKVRWSKDEPPPEIGTRIRVTINNCGPAVVTGYFTQDGWLGIICDLTDPPDWHVKQNKGNPRGHVFGPEFERID